MSTTMSDSTTTVREFSSHDVNFIANDDLRLELRKGGNKNTSNDWNAGEARVLVTINVDGCSYSNVEVQAAHSRGYVDAVDAAFEAISEVRDQLHKMSGVGSSTEILAIYDNLDEDSKTQLADEARRLLEDLQKELTAQAAAVMEARRKA